MVAILEMSNKYMQEVQAELDRKNWRDVVREAAQNKYQPLEFEEPEQDPEVDRLFAELERQVIQKGLEQYDQHHQPVMVKVVSVNTPVVQVQPLILVKAASARSVVTAVDQRILLN
jgi:hypothetical protein